MLSHIELHLKTAIVVTITVHFDLADRHDLDQGESKGCFPGPKESQQKGD